MDVAQEDLSDKADVNMTQEDLSNETSNSESEAFPTTPTEPAKESKQSFKSLFKRLFEAYRNTDDREIVKKHAILYLIKNQGAVNEEIEDPKKYESRIRNKKKQIERLEEQLKSRLPRFRSISDKHFPSLFGQPDGESEPSLLESAKNRNRTQTQNKYSDIPYEVIFRSRDDIIWKLAQRRNHEIQALEERIFIRIKGTNRNAEGDLKYSTFEVCCDKRHIAIFQRCFEEWQIYENNKKEFTTREFLLQSASLVWRKKKTSKKDNTKPFTEIDNYEAYLKLTIDTRRLTAEGAERVRNEEFEKVTRTIDGYEKKRVEGELDEQKERGLKRSQTTLRKLQNIFERPSRPQYQGEENLVLGVSFGLEKPIAAAVVDINTGKKVACRSDKQLLGVNYEQLLSYRHQQNFNSSRRRREQRQRKSAKITEQARGEYINRLIAKAVVNLAQEYKAGLIVLADYKHIRESIQSEIDAKAEQKYPKDRSRQRAYLKQYRVNVNKWDHRRLSECIRDRAGRIGIPIRAIKQTSKGNLQVRAAALALSAKKIVKQ